MIEKGRTRDVGNRALKLAMAAAKRLSPRLQRQLAEQLIAATASEENTIQVFLQQLPLPKQARLAELMDKSNDGRLSPAEQVELGRLGAEVDHLMLANSQALARTLRPELFDERGRPITRRFRQGLGKPPVPRATPKRRRMSR